MIIGITGYKQNGKDTLCDHLVSQYGYTKTRFAAKLKYITQLIFNFTDTSEEAKENFTNVTIYDRNIVLGFKEIGIPVHLWDTMLSVFYAAFGKHILCFNDCGAELYVSNRLAQQLIGTEVGRAYNENLWVELVDISEANTVIADCRFPNEAEFIKNKGGIIIKVINPRMENDDTHASESYIGQMPYDYLIENDGTLEELYKKIDKVMEEINGN